MLFARKYNIPLFRLPRLDGITLELSKEAKYLGVILDSKLSWKQNAESLYVPFIHARRLLGKYGV